MLGFYVVEEEATIPNNSDARIVVRCLAGDDATGWGGPIDDPASCVNTIRAIVDASLAGYDFFVRNGASVAQTDTWTVICADLP